MNHDRLHLARRRHRPGRFVHLFSGKLRFLEGNPRSVWLSIAGVVSVAYVFVDLIPEFGKGQEVIAEVVGQDLSFLEKHVYLMQ